MRNRLFLALIICLSIFAFAAHADNAAIGVLTLQPEASLASEASETFFEVKEWGNIKQNRAEEVFVGGFGFDEEDMNTPPESEPLKEGEEFEGERIQKDIPAPEIPQFPVAPYLNRNSLNASGPGTGPGTAPQFPINAYYSEVLGGTGAQHWIYVQASMTGQMTVHLDVPDSPNIDYDLYVYSYDPSTGNLYTFKQSQYGPGMPEHISFSASQGDYYFIHVQSYQGGSTTIPYYLHVEMAKLDPEEINDTPNQASSITPNSNGMYGDLSMRNDEDWIKFTPTGNKGILEIQLSNSNINVDLYRLNATTGDLSGVQRYTGAGRGEFTLNTTAGVTYYFHILHKNNKVLSNSSYALRVNSFTCSETVAQSLGRTSDNRRIAYVTNSDNLYVNSTRVLQRLAQSARYSYDHNTGNIRYQHESYASSPVREALFLRYYSTTRNDVDSMSNALALYVRRDPAGSGGDMGAHFENKLYKYIGGVWNTEFQNGYAAGYYILDLSDNKIKDFMSYGLGFYNGFFGTGDWWYDWIVD